MLKGDPNEGLLSGLPTQNSTAPPHNSAKPSSRPASPRSPSREINQQSTSQITEPPPQASKIDRESKPRKKKSKQRSECTWILKVMNFVVGGVYLAFGVYCYVYGFQNDHFKQKPLFIQYLMPAYLGISGLMILLIECRIGFVVNNLRCLYNYCGRGIFNIYAGTMPLMLVDDWKDIGTFQILTLVAASLMCLIGILYIMLKMCCCEKQGRKIDNYNRRKSRRHSSDSDQQSD